MKHFLTGHPDAHPALGGHPKGQGAGATIVRKTVMAPALTASWRGSVTVKGKRGKAGTGIGREGTEGRGREDGPAAQTGIRTDESVEEVTAAAGTERASVETKKETAAMTGAGGRTGNIIKIEALRERSPGTRRTGEKLMTGGIKTTGRGTGRKGKPKGQAGVEAGKGSTKVEERRRTGKEIVATAEIESGREMESNALTKRGATITESQVTTIVDIVNAEGVRAPTKRRLQQCFYFCSRVFLPFFLSKLSDLSLVLKRRNVSTWDICRCRLLSVLILLYVCFVRLFSTSQ